MPAHWAIFRTKSRGLEPPVESKELSTEDNCLFKQYWTKGYCTLGHWSGDYGFGEGRGVGGG